MSVAGAAARALNLKTAAVWAVAAVMTAVAVSSVSAALERDDLIAQGNVRQARLVQLAEQLDELEGRDRDASEQRVRLLEEIRGLREQLIDAGVTPAPRPLAPSSATPGSARGSVRPPKRSASPAPSGRAQTGRSSPSGTATRSSSPDPARPSPSPSPSATCRGVLLPVLGCVGG